MGVLLDLTRQLRWSCSRVI